MFQINMMCAANPHKTRLKGNMQDYTEVKHIRLKVQLMPNEVNYLGKNNIGGSCSLP